MTKYLPANSTARVQSAKHVFVEHIDEQLVSRHQKPVLFQGDAANAHFFVEKNSVDVVTTSPPYWYRRDYDHPDQLGQEADVRNYIYNLTSIINSWKPILKKHASVFINIGDTYKDKVLAGVPARLEMALRDSSWNIVNHIIWAKSSGTPQPRSHRLANRHESIFQLTCSKDYYFDIFRLSAKLNQSANPGDFWELPDDVWQLHGTRNMSDHLAPFPPELAERILLLACPQYVCSSCGRPFTRSLEPTSDLNVERPQARRAMELFRQHKLTEDHLKAIRAVGIGDAGKGKRIQKTANSARTAALASEAKEALGGYFREFTFAPKRQIGWVGCKCEAPIVPGTVLDPFMGTGTTLKVADKLGFSSFGIDLTPPQNF